MLRRTKIVATLGPATDAPGVLEDVIRRGADVVRLNFSHGVRADQVKRVEAVRAASERVGKHVAGELVIGDADAPRSALVRLDCGIEREKLALVQDDVSIGKALDADLGSLQVAEHRDVLADLLGRGPDRFDALDLIGADTVRKVEPHDVRSAPDHVLEHARRVRGRPQRSDDLGAT